jgi:hypothetical protein
VVVNRFRRSQSFAVVEQSGMLHGHPCEGLPLDHFQMNKFRGPDDNAYERVKNELRRIAKAAADLVVITAGDRNGRVIPPEIA